MPRSSRKTGAPRPESVAREIRTFLRQRSDPVQAASNQRFFKEPVPCFGVKTPVLRRFVRDRIRALRPIWTARDALRLSESTIRDPEVETKVTGVLVLQAWAAGLRPADLPRIRRWLERHSGNWGVVDALAACVLAPLLDARPGLVPRVVAWTASPSLWVRRAAAVALVPSARRGRRLAVAYRIARRLLDDDEDLVHKAVGWLLREAGATDRARLTAFLRKHGPVIPRTTLRYAIEKHPAGERRALLAATRASAGSAGAPGSRAARRGRRGRSSRRAAP